MRISSHLILRLAQPVALFLIPLLLLPILGGLSEARGPFHYGSNSDPEYCYLFNSLNLLTLNIPVHIDHPGTTLQELGAAIIAGRWLVGDRGRPLVEAVLARPEPYLGTVRLALNLLFCAMLGLAGVRIGRLTGSLIPSIVFQVTFLTSLQILMAETRVSPEPLLVVASLALFLALMPVVFGEQTDREAASARRALFAGAVFGFAVVTKVTILPLAALAFVFPGWRQPLRFAGGALASAFVFAFPIVTQLGRVFEWILLLLTHQGKYGSGETGLPPLARLADGLALTYRLEPQLYWFLAFYVAALLLFHRQWSGSLQWRLAIAGTAAMTGVILATAKAPAPQYLVPAACLPPLLNALLADLLRREPRSSVRGWAAVAAGALVLLAAHITLQNRALGRLERMNHYRNDVESQLALLEAAAGCRAAGVYRSSLLSAAMALGNDFSRGLHGPVLARLYPDAMYYNRYRRRFGDFQGDYREEKVRRMVADGQCLLVQGSEAGMKTITGFGMTTLESAADERVVKLLPLVKGK